MDKVQIERRFKGGEITYIDACYALANLSVPMPTGFRTVRRWQNEAHEMMVEAARQDPRTVARATILAMGNTGDGRYVDAQSANDAFEMMVSGMMEGMIGMARPGEPLPYHDWNEGMIINEHQAERLARAQAQAEVDSWIERLAEFKDEPLPPFWKDADEVITQWEDDDA